MRYDWEKMKEQKCPRCGSDMVVMSGALEGEEYNRVVCTSENDSECRFILTAERFADIVKHGTYKQSPRITPQWQLIHKNKCPICGDYLTGYYDSNYKICGREVCNFKISLRRLQQIEDNENHPANMYKDEPANTDRNLELLYSG